MRHFYSKFMCIFDSDIFCWHIDVVLKHELFLILDFDHVFYDNTVFSKDLSYCSYYLLVGMTYKSHVH